MTDETQPEMPLVHEELRERLRKMIGHTWKAGDKLPPIKELARDLEAGHVNTHRAIKQLVGEGLLLSRPRRGTVVNPRLGQPPTLDNAVNNRRIVLVTAQDRRELFLRPAVESLTKGLTEAGASCHHATFSLSQDQPALDLSAYQSYDAIVTINPPTPVPLAAREGQPLLVLTTCQDQRVSMAGGYDIVSVDSEQGGYLAGEHCRRLGVERIAYIGREADRDLSKTHGDSALDVTCQLRLRGCCQGWRQSLDQVLVHTVADYMSHEGAEALPWFLQLDPRPDAVFCASDELAIGFAHGALAHGLVPGEDVQLIGFDGQTRGRELLAGGLTTVDIPSELMGHTAAELLIRRLQAYDAPVRRVFLACRFYQGATTRTTD